MSLPLLLRLYQQLPEQGVDENPAVWAFRYRVGVTKFKRDVGRRYEEATLERLLSHAAAEVRQAAVLAMGLLGTMQVNVAVATRLHDDDATVCQLACDDLWSLWFRGDAPDHARELQRLMRHELNERNAAQVLDRYAALIKRAPAFAEAYNQRAIVHFRLEAF